jgi:hypothetical protein
LQRYTRLPWKLKGDPTEGALLFLACKTGLKHVDISKSYPRLSSL